MKRKIIWGLLVIAIAGYFYSSMKMNVTDPDFMNEQLAEMEALFPERDALSTEVSQVPIAWHLDHMLKTINNITAELASSDPATFNGSFDVTRVMALTFNYMPRGKAQAPDAVRPPDIIHTEALERQLEEARMNLRKVFQYHEQTHFEHPVFGDIDRGNTLRFIEVHTNHHLKIIRDILKE